MLADVGGYVLVMKDVFHKVFANSKGNYVEYELSGDPRYNSTGLIRVHLKKSNPQLGPSDGIPHRWDNKKKKDLGGELYAVGPAWFDLEGREHRLAEYTNVLYPDSTLYSAYNASQPPIVDIKVEKQNWDAVEFKIIYKGDFSGVTQIVQHLCINEEGIMVKDVVTGSLKGMRVYYPILIDDGAENTQIGMGTQQLRLKIRDGEICFHIVEPADAILKRANKKLYFRNGYADVAYFESKGNVMLYKISG